MRTEDTVVAPPSSFAPPSSSDSYASDAWRRVRVHDVQVERALPPATRAMVRLCLDLGVLLPPDVEVELTIAGEPEASIPALVTERMWCAHSYHNGRYDFVADVPDAVVAGARRMSATVRPEHPGVAGHAVVASVPTATVVPAATTRLEWHPVFSVLPPPSLAEAPLVGTDEQNP